MRRLILIVLCLLLVVTISAQDSSQALDCTTYEILTGQFGDLAFLIHQIDGEPMAVSVDNYLEYFDSILGGECSGHAEPITREVLLETASPHDASSNRDHLVFASDDYGFEGNLPLITIPAGRYQYTLEGIRRWGDQTEVAEWWVYKRTEGDTCWTLFPSNNKVFGRMSLAKDCSTYWTIYNRNRIPWRIEFIREAE